LKEQIIRVKKLPYKSIFMKKIFLFVYCFSISLIILGQSNYAEECLELRCVAFEEEFNWKNIEQQVNKLENSIAHSSEIAIISCNCADTLWIANKNHDRQRTYFSHGRSQSSYLDGLSIIADSLLLDKRFQILNLNTLEERFHFVVDRLDYKGRIWKNKATRECHQKSYNLINSEATFLRKNCEKLLPSFLKILDSEHENRYLKDIILVSLWNSNKEVEREILPRFRAIAKSGFASRLFGVLSNVGSQKTVEFFTDEIECKDISKYRYMVSNIVYEILKRDKLPEQYKDNFEESLRRSGLEELIRDET